MILFLHKDKCNAIFSYLHECTFKNKNDFLKNLKETMRFLQKQATIPFEKGILMLTPLKPSSEPYSKPVKI